MCKSFLGRKQDFVQESVYGMLYNPETKSSERYFKIQSFYRVEAVSDPPTKKDLSPKRI